MVFKNTNSLHYLSALLYYMSNTIPPGRVSRRGTSCSIRNATEYSTTMASQQPKCASLHIRTSSNHRNGSKLLSSFDSSS